MDVVLISVGTELVTGQVVDTNAAWLSERLTLSGAVVRGCHVCGDVSGHLAGIIALAMSEADLVLMTGGLGPTEDDVTRQALATALGVPLYEDAAALAQIHAVFARWGREMHPANHRQALVPEGASVVENPLGTAPGICHRGDRCTIFALPGVPREMKAMFDRAVVPDLADRLPAERAAMASVACYGASESRIGELLADLMVEGRNPAVGTTATGGVITVRIVARADDQASAEALAGGQADEVRARLGHVVFGSGGDTIEAAVGRLLLARGETLAVAESCTGGLIAKRLTDMPGSSGYFLQGVVTYANDAKIQRLGVAAEDLEASGAVSEPVARAMAVGCRSSSGSDYALSTTGIAGPGGGSPPDKPVGLVFVGCASEAGVVVKRLLLGAHLGRSELRDRAAKAALNLLRLTLLDTG